MNNVLTLNQVHERVEHDDAGKRDVIVARRDVSLASGKLLVPTDGEHRLTPLPWAMGQLTAKLSIPTAFFRQLPAHLQDDVFNHCNARGIPADTANPEKEERWLLRTQGGTLRGVLSERYRKFDNTDLLAALSASLPRHLRITSCELTETSLHLRVIDPTTVLAATPGDDLMAGIHIVNSEVGYRSVIISLIIYRLVCSNGMVKMVEQKHLLQQRHSFLPGDEFNKTVYGAIQNAIAVASLALEQFVQSTRWRLPDVASAIKVLGIYWGLSQRMQEDIASALRREKSIYQESGYGLINAITEVAKHQAPDSRFDLERLAGSLLDNASLRSLISNPPAAGTVLSRRSLRTENLLREPSEPDSYLPGARHIDGAVLHAA